MLIETYLHILRLDVEETLVVEVECLEGLDDGGFHI